MKYYKAIISHFCSFKLCFENSEDADKLVREYIRNQNSGEAKSDRLHVIQVRSVTKKEYDYCNWPDHTYLFTKPLVTK